MGNQILEIRNLSVQYETMDGIVKAVNNVDLTLENGSILGLVGETGAGKTTLAKSIMRLNPPIQTKVTSGTISFDGCEMLNLSEKEMRRIRGKQISMMFQDPMTSLNPVMRVSDQIAEAIMAHEKIGEQEAHARALAALELVGISAERGNDYPHQFSGGMKQRVVIAIGLVCEPRILIADEPTTALDVTIQAQVLQLMGELRQKLNTSMLLITHDLGIVAQNCECVAIMYAGEIVESGTVKDIFNDKRHPYTKGLFLSIPNIAEPVHRLTPIDGLMPDPTNLPEGCAFCDRCKYATERCRKEKPGKRNVGGEKGTHIVKCFLEEETSRGE
ncbi:MAG: ABC transporter ATP-binding protein [Clostridia bacterium]|nr:ABC transporter ATP-binding protein [Clostridia bacterium]